MRALSKQDSSQLDWELWKWKNMQLMRKGRQLQTEGSGRIQEAAAANAFKTKSSQHLQELVCYLHLCPQLVSKSKEADLSDQPCLFSPQRPPVMKAFFFPKSSWSQWKHFLVLFLCNFKINKSLTKSQFRDESPLKRNHEGTLIVCPVWAVDRGACRAWPTPLLAREIINCWDYFCLWNEGGEPLCDVPSVPIENQHSLGK